MQLQVILILVSSLFFKAHALNCYECTPDASGKCSDTQVACDLGQCASMSVIAYAAGSKIVDLNSKSCTVPEACISASVNFGISRATVSSKCCSTELCNAQSGPEMTNQSPNGKKCFTCNGQDCSSTLSCVGGEDRCIKTTVEAGGQKLTMKGCATKTICVSDMAQLVPGLGLGLNCCEGNLCNGAKGVGQSLFLMMAALALITLFH